MAFSFSGSSSTTKSHDWIDPRTSNAQWGNWYDAQQLTPTYVPTTTEQISSYQSPYASQVIDPTLAAIERSRQMAVNDTADRAVTSHAYGGSRHGVAEALTNEGYANQAAQTAGQLYNQNYAQALAAAQHENEQLYRYPLDRQAALNQSLGGITPEHFSKNKTVGFKGGWEQGSGSLLGDFNGLWKP